MKVCGASPRATRYSEKELAMLSLFVSPSVLRSTDPWTAYRLAVFEAFRQDARGPHVDSLRRTFTAFSHSTMSRLTPQWDELIQLPDHKADTTPLAASATE
jgi:hypothetical protein